MKKIRLIRLPETSNGTFGVLLDEGTPFCLTLEPRWLNNRKNESCIPVGTYRCRRIRSKKFGETFEVCDVPSRSGILFHAGNAALHTKGCILLGEQFEYVGEVPGLAFSRKAMEEFLRRTADVDQFWLEITQV